MSIAKRTVLGLGFDTMTLEELVARLDRGAVFAANVDHFMLLRRDPGFLAAYAAAEHVVCDSRIVLAASRFLGTPLPDRVCGADLFPAFCRARADDSGTTLFLFGVDDATCAEAAARIDAKAGRPMVVGWDAPKPGFADDPAEGRRMADVAARSGATVVVVGLGSPGKEVWITRHRHLVPRARLFLALGAAVDFTAGRVPRAPAWMGNAGLEWLFRLLSEPRRLWRRYLWRDPPFLWFLLLERLGFRHLSAPLQEGIERAAEAGGHGLVGVGGNGGAAPGAEGAAQAGIAQEPVDRGGE